jgi:hypothetical protein
MAAVRRHPYAAADYDGDNHLRLAEKIDAALDNTASANERRLLRVSCWRR